MPQPAHASASHGSFTVDRACQGHRNRTVDSLKEISSGYISNTSQHDTQHTHRIMMDISTHYIVPSAQPTTTSWLSAIVMGIKFGVAIPANFVGRGPSTRGRAPPPLSRTCHCIDGHREIDSPSSPSPIGLLVSNRHSRRAVFFVLREIMRCGHCPLVIMRRHEYLDTHASHISTPYHTHKGKRGGEKTRRRQEGEKTRRTEDKERRRRQEGEKMRRREDEKEKRR
ncbi:hypothetical protein JB92DRAFT_2824483 [Gautieria morchelliformis]|nr:hypothetical protein JB92DRAFT_2824483 [Gautieria morchelliformis]